MQQDLITQIIDTGQSAYVALLFVPCEIGITRGTLKKYLTYLGIEPICFHISTRRLSISREAMAQVKQLKQTPTFLAQLRSPVLAHQDSS